MVERHEAPSREELEARLARPPRRGRAADPGRLGGEDRRRARLPARAAGHRGRDAAAALAGLRARRARVRRRERARSSCTSAPARTSARSRRRSAATAGRCGARPSGPFTVEEADARAAAARSSEALARLPADAVARVPEAIRGARARGRGADGRRRVRPQREGRPRARRSSSAGRARSRSAPSTASTSAIARSCGAAVEAGPLPTVVTFHPHPREVLGNQVALLATLERRLELLADARRGGDARRRVHAGRRRARRPRSSPRSYLAAIGAELVVAGEDVPLRARTGSGDLALLERARLRDAASSPHVEGVSSTRHPPARGRGRRARRGARCSAGRSRSRAWSSRAMRAAARSASRPRTCASSRRCSCRAFGIYAGCRARAPRGGLDRRQPALRRRRAPDRGLPARLRGRPLRAAARRRALGAPARRGRVRERGRARRADRARRGRPRGPPTRP